MALTDFKDFPRRGRLLGIDWGMRRVGTAVSSPDQGFVFAAAQIANSKEQIAIKEIVKIIESENIVGIVLGLPLYADGSDSETTKMVREFAANLAKETPVPIVFIEENLTSVAAGERMKDEGRRMKDIDSESAAVILENGIAMIKRTHNV